ncbi:two-component sensor histidine kinase [Telmatocola sphagniphila]|uniref:histidine kinase n=1 Tax=Telmatocola sphagniphila TaxID=1123043 RepID=A0A8E6EZE1_9BACT|nr:ATP-binding protein [Telmatocola sphagniphila]QVL33653.1 two-component sensor histidine kinase [Telmatocola sphagniphila]
MPSAEQFTELAEVAGGFIHEIKNHIATLGLNLQLLAEDYENPQSPKERRIAERIQRLQTECTKITDISNDFLRFARAQELLRLEIVRLDDVVSEVIDFFQPTAQTMGIQLTWYPCGDSARVKIDPQVFKQAMLNLLINAKEAMPEGGEIILQDYIEGEFIRLDVIDTGSGIPTDQLEKIFKPFHTTKMGGTGLGLPTTRKVIEALGGSIEVQSEVGTGTKFSILLPILKSQIV